MNIKEMVNKFLGWKLPKDFCPDAGISFKPTKPHEGDEYGNSWWPVGTNLFTAEQAEQMFKYCLEHPKEENSITDSERLAALKKHLTVISIDRWECDALLALSEGRDGIFFQSKDDFSVEAALDWLVMEERRKA